MRTQLCMATLGLSATVVMMVAPDNGNHSGHANKKPGQSDDVYTYTVDFGLQDGAVLMPDGGNQYFSLTPGNFYRLEGVEDGEFVEVEITVMDAVEPIWFESDGNWSIAFARVVEEREWIDGELGEVTLNYYARCAKTSNIYYFGEFVEHYENGVVVDNEGSWFAGVDGAQPGLLIPASFLLGARYQQELAPGVSMDRGENVEMGVTYETPAGRFEDCIVIEETTPLEPDEITLNVYAPGVGPVADGPLQLVEYQLN